jgi:hypothetical protein
MTKAILLTLVLLTAMLVPVEAGFVATYPAMDNHRHNIQFNGTAGSIVSERNYTVNATTSVYYALVVNEGHRYLNGTGYVVDFEHCSYAATIKTCTPLASGVNHTNPSPERPVLANITYAMRATLKYPGGDKGIGDVPVLFHLVLNQSSPGAGSGGTGLPTLAHHVTLRFYDSFTDTDADFLPDAWERKWFGDLGQGAGDDPDGDGFTNLEEFEAGSDPTDKNSTPAQKLGGGGRVTDRVVGNMVAGLLLWSVIIFLVVLFVQDRLRERALFTILTLVGAALLVAFVLLFLLDVVVLDGQGWAWWTFLDASWQVWSVAAVGGSVILTGSAAAFIKLKQAAEYPASIAVAGAVAVFGLLVYVLFGVLELPLPF